MEFYKIKIEKLQKELENINNVLKRHKFSELQKVIKKFQKNCLKMPYMKNINIFIIITHMIIINQK